MGGHVFIAYDPRDVGYVRRLGDHLRSADIEVWFEDPASYGGSWLTEVRPRIDSCAAFMVVMTPAAEHSAWVDRLVTRALEMRVPIRPLLLAGQWAFARLSDRPFHRIVGGGLPRPPYLFDLRSTVGQSPVEPAGPAALPAPFRTLELPPSEVDMSGWSELELDLHRPSIESVAWSPDGRTVAVAGNDEKAFLWDLRSDTIRAQLCHPDGVMALAWSPDGCALATIGARGDVRVWDPQTGTRRRALRTSEGHAFLLAWSPDGTALATASDDDQVVRIWSTNSWTQARAVPRQHGRTEGGAWSPAGDRLALPVRDSRVSIWDTNTGTRVAELVGHTATVWALAWSPDGSHIATVSDDDTIGVWDADRAIELATITNRDSVMRCVAWSPDGRRLAAGGGDLLARVWDVDSGDHLATLDDHTYVVFSVAWSPDGRYLVTGGDRTVRMWAL